MRAKHAERFDVFFLCCFVLCIKCTFDMSVWECLESAAQIVRNVHVLNVATQHNCTHNV